MMPTLAAALFLFGLVCIFCTEALRSAFLSVMDKPGRPRGAYDRLVGSRYFYWNTKIVGVASIAGSMVVAMLAMMISL